MFNKAGKKMLCVILVFITVVCMFPAGALSQSENPVQFQIAESYQFTMSGGGNHQSTDSFQFEEAYFLNPSSSVCLPLAELSAQVSLASTSWYGDGEDPLELDPSENAHNLVAMLGKMGFENIEFNAYYSLEELENSAAVAIACKSLSELDETCTLIAIVPRSAGYKQEWAGDFLIGATGMHEGFRAARDEALRFLKQYIENHEIRGRIKVWIAGHSRGAAVANLIAGFLAGGGAIYFGSDVQFAPEDIYCYGTATPSVIRSGISQRNELSVSGTRGGDYGADTPGEPFVYPGEGTCIPNSPIYAGIKSCAMMNDLVSALTPQKWGYSRYGETVLLDSDPSLKQDMLSELSELHMEAYRALADNTEQNWYTFDSSVMAPILDPDRAGENADHFFAERLTGLLRSIPTVDVYVEDGYQEAFQSAGGSYGMLKALLKGHSRELLPKLKKPFLYCYLSYAAERFMEEGRVRSDGEAIADALVELLSFVSEKNLDPESCTVDEFVALLAEFVSCRAEIPEVQNTIASAAESFPQDIIFWIRLLFSGFQKNYDFFNPAPDSELLLNFILACANGPAPDTSAAGTYSDAAAVRRSLYGLLDRTLGTAAPNLGDAIGRSGNGFDGKGSFRGFVEALMPVLLTQKDENGKVVQVYRSIAEAADGLLAESIISVLEDPAEEAETIYGARYGADVKRHIQNLSGSVSACRKAIFYTLFYTEGKPFSTSDNIRNACTAYMLLKTVASSHYSECYIAWIRSLQKAE